MDPVIVAFLRRFGRISNFIMFMWLYKTRKRWSCSVIWVKYGLMANKLIIAFVDVLLPRLLSERCKQYGCRQQRREEANCASRSRCFSAFNDDDLPFGQKRVRQGITVGGWSGNCCLHRNTQGLELANKTVQNLLRLNRRTLDQLAARIYFYHARFYELTNRLNEIRP